MGLLIFYSLVGGLFSLIGGLLLLWRSELVKQFTLPFFSFAAGAFLGAAFLDILPEAVQMVQDSKPVFVAALVGYLVFFGLERIIMRYFHTGHKDGNSKHADHTESLPPLLIAGDALHNFLDGVVIALAYIADPTIGLITTLAVAAHEIPQEIGDFTILINQGWSKLRVLTINVLQSLLTVLGALLGYYIGHAIEPSLPYLLAAAGGMFIYLGASDLIPEVHHQAGHRHVGSVMVLLILGILAVGILTYLAEGS